MERASGLGGRVGAWRWEEGMKTRDGSFGGGDNYRGDLALRLFHTPPGEGSHGLGRPLSEGRGSQWPRVTPNTSSPLRFLPGRETISWPVLFLPIRFQKAGA